jgi:3-oxoacyl-[acyl-carrier-protein] synthase II
MTMKSSARRVVVTGMGILCPNGNDLPSAWKNICAGKSGIGTITHFDAGELTCRIAGEVKDFNPAEHLDAREARRYDRFIHFALVACKQALTMAGLTPEIIAGMDATRLGVNIGSGIGGLPEIENTARAFFAGGQRKISPFFIPATIGNMAAGMVSINFGLKGPNYGCVSACATANHSIGDAYRAILFGDAEVMVAGGTEATITGLAIGGFAAMKALSVRNDDPATASRPWSKGRDGFVMGEGAGVLILEEYEHAKARDVTILAELVGYGATSDAHHITAPCENGEGAARCIRMALDSARINADVIGYINAHGTSTPLGDVAETVAIHRALGEHANKVVVSSTKSMTGHLLGAAGGIEAVFSIMALIDNLIPPTINLLEADAGCNLDYCANIARPQKVDYVLSNSFGFGGTNSSLIFKRL